VEAIIKIRNRLGIALLTILVFPLGCGEDEKCPTGPAAKSKLVIVGGNNQVGTVGTRLPDPLGVAVQSSAGEGVSDVNVIWKVESGSATVSDTLVVTDNSGVVLTFVDLGPSVGDVEVSATGYGLQGSPATFTLTAVASNAVNIQKISGDGQEGTVGQALENAIVIRATDAYGNPVENTQIHFEVDPSYGSVEPTTAMTDTSGYAQTNWTLGTTTGQQTMRSYIDGISFYPVTFIAAAAADVPDDLVLLSGGGQGGIVGEELSESLVFAVRDQYENGVPDLTVEFSVISGGGSCDPTSASTDNSGRVSTRWTLGAQGVNEIRAGAAGLEDTQVTAMGYSPVELLPATATFSTVELSWQENTNDGFISYQLYRDTNPGVDETSTLVTTVTSSSQTTYSDGDFVVGSMYYYRLFVNFEGGFVLRSQEIHVNAGLRAELAVNAFKIVLDTERDRLYASLPDLNSVAVVSTSSFEVIDEVIVGSRPQGIALSLDGSVLYSALNGAGAVAVLDLSTQEVTEIDVGTELGDARTYDVIEAKENTVLVTSNPSSSGFAYVVKIDRAGGNAAGRVAGNRIIRSRPTLARDPAGTFAYVGTGFSPNSLYKLDLNVASCPIVLEDDHGSVSGTDRIEVSPDGSRIYLRSGQVLHSGSFNQAGSIGSGVPELNEDGTLCYVGTGSTINIYDTVTFLQVGSIPVPEAVDHLILFEDGTGLYMLADDVIYGIPLP
jgi:hypothetical protein